MNVVWSIALLAFYGWSLRTAWRRPDRDVALLLGGGTVALLFAAEWVGALTWALLGAVHAGRRWRLWETTHLGNGIRVTHPRGMDVR